MSLQILSEDFEPDILPPADLESIIIEAYQEYELIPSYTKDKKLFRNALNECISILSEKRNTFI